MEVTQSGRYKVITPLFIMFTKKAEAWALWYSAGCSIFFRAFIWATAIHMRNVTVLSQGSAARISFHLVELRAFFTSKATLHKICFLQWSISANFLPNWLHRPLLSGIQTASSTDHLPFRMKSLPIIFVDEDSSSGLFDFGMSIKLCFFDYAWNIPSF